MLGCGNIGSAVCRLIQEQKDFFEKEKGVCISINRVLVRSLDKKRDCDLPREVYTTRPEEVLNADDIDVVMEFLGGEQPAAEYICTALLNGKNVITANKLALATHWNEIQAARRNGKAQLLYEASVCGAIPVIHVLRTGCQANPLRSVMGIINGTTNYILSRMSDEGCTYDEALKAAQKLGYAEPDPTMDVEGLDAVYKLSILSTLAFRRHLPAESIYHEGITAIQPLDLQMGKEFGLTLKLLAIAKAGEDGVECRVHPTLIPDGHPLASVKGAFNAVLVDGTSSGEMMFYGKGAGDMPTASALVSDLIKLTDHAGEDDCLLMEKGTVVEDWTSRFFVRMRVPDRTGILSMVSGVFARHGVSIAQMVQRQIPGDEEGAMMIFLTHLAREKATMKALRELADFTSDIHVIRVENHDEA